MDGIINVYKEAGFTSFDVVAKLRGILHTRKIGHTGTLDPMAVGVLPVCVGSATKLCERLTDHDKVYEAVMILGCTYDTLDITGNKLTEKVVMSTKEDVKEAIDSFIGGYDQVPPMYSAKKVDGRKLYELAREGKEIERKSVHVDIMDIQILEMDLPKVRMRIHCGKGTYIRSLISDIGDKLTCGAAMESLVRTKVGDFDIESAHTLSDIERMMNEGKISQYMFSVDAAFMDCERLDLSECHNKIIDNGNAFGHEALRELIQQLNRCMQDGEMIRIYDCAGRFRAVYMYSADRNVLKPYKMFIPS